MFNPSNKALIYEGFLVKRGVQFMSTFVTMATIALRAYSTMFINCEELATVGVITNKSRYRKCQDYVYIKWEYWSTM